MGPTTGHRITPETLGRILRKMYTEKKLYEIVILLNFQSVKIKDLKQNVSQ